MTTLASLLVARQAASTTQVDEALARQMVEGGDLVTCLLELDTISERTLIAVLGEAYGIEPASLGELPVASQAVLRLVPRAVAIRHGLYPLEERDGDLWVAVAEPLLQAVEDDLGFALGAHLRQFVAPMARIRQAITRDYGAPLDRRFSRLLARLDDRPDPSPSDPPLPGHAPAFPEGAIAAESDTPVPDHSGTLMVSSGVPPPSSPSQLPGYANPTPAHPISVPPPRRNTWPGMLFVQDEATPPPPPIPSPPATPVVPPDPALTHQTSPGLAPPSLPPLPQERVEARAESRPPERRLTPPPPPADFVMEATSATAAQVEKRRRRRAEQPTGKALVGWARRAIGNNIAADRSPERRRGPLTPADAELELEEAHTGDEALGIFFAFARQFFEYSVLFTVHGDLAAGHDAWGAGSSREKVRAVGVALDLPGALSEARDRATPILAKLKRAGLDADLRNDLARSATAEVLILPIMVLGRCVALLYGDDGDLAVDYTGTGEVVAMASLLASTLERVLMRKKRAALRDTSGIKSKLGPSDRSQISLPPVTDRPSEKARAATPVPRADAAKASPTHELSRIAVKRVRAEEPDLVDEGWSVPTDAELVPRTSTPPRPMAAPVKSRTPAKTPKAPESAPITPQRTPPPRQVAAVRAVSGPPIAREEYDDTAEVTVAEAAVDDVSLEELLGDLEEHPSPAPPVVDGTAGAAAAEAAMPLTRRRDSSKRPADPLASAAYSVDPHAPPPSRALLRDLPSVLIRPELVTDVIAGGEKADKALTEILALGEAAIPAVFARFPGPVTVDRNQALGDLPKPADCGPVLRIVAAMRRLALPFLAVRSADAEVEVRFWATYLLGELNYADATAALLPRLFDENMAVRRIAVRSARSLVASGDEALPLRRSLERMIAYPDEPIARRLIAIWTIGELKLYRSIPSLIAALSDPLDPIVEGAARALAAMTRQEYGNDARKWGEWWDTKGRKRVT
jgi:hypothetical protein